MLRISDLVDEHRSIDDLPLVVDPIRENDALVEAALLSVMTIMVNNTIAFLFDLRPSLFMDQGNVGILIIRGVSELSISFFPSPLQVWTVNTSQVIVQQTHYLVNINNRIYTKARSVEFITGRVDGIGEVAQSLDDGLDAYLQTIPDWSSEIHITGMSRLSIDS